MYIVVGNPCATYQYYREFVITILPGLKMLDGISVERSERIVAKQKFSEIKTTILQQEQEYFAKREKEKEEFKENEDVGTTNDADEADEDKTEKRRKYFSEKSNYTPETRMEMQQVLEEINQEKENVGDVPKKEKKERQLFMK